MSDARLLQLLRGGWAVDHPSLTALSREQQLELGVREAEDLMGGHMDFMPEELAQNAVVAAAEPLQALYYRTTGAHAAQIPEEHILQSSPQFASWRQAVGIV